MNQSPWDSWLEALPPNQLGDLLTTMQRRYPEVLSKEESESVETVRPPTDTFYYPKCPPYVDVHNLIPIYQKLAFHQNLLIKGPKGDGKTLSVQHFAHSTQTPIVTLNCSEGTDEKHLLGSFFLRGRNSSPFSLGALPTAIDVANEVGRAILVFEELNGLTPEMQKVLNPLLDFRKQVVVERAGKVYQLRDGAFLWCVATMNPVLYGGTYELNADLRSRWEELEVGYPSQNQEAAIIKSYVPPPSDPTGQAEYNSLVKNAIRLANDTRQNTMQYALSTRDLVRFVTIAQTIGKENALQLLVCKFEGEDRDTAMARISAVFKGVRVKKHWGA